MNGSHRPPPHWSASYLGLPYVKGGLDRDGVSCWGLVRLVYAERCGIVLPSYEGEIGAEERGEVAAALAGDAEQWPWFPVAASEARAFDLVTFRYGDIEAHIGVIPWPGAFLHAGEGIVSRVERYGENPWQPLTGRFLRHRSLRDV